MTKRRRCFPTRRVSGGLLSASLLAGGLAGSTVAVAGPAGADNSGTPVCGPAVPISGNNNVGAPAALTVPQYNGGGTLTAATLSLQATESYSGQFRLGSPPFSIFPGTASIDFVGVSSVLEATGPGLGALAPVTVGATFKGNGPDSFLAGDPAPTLPTGVATANGIGADGVGTGTSVPSTWTGLGFPFTASSPSPATAQGTVALSTNDGSIPSSSFASYTGSGNVAISAADYTTDSVSSDSSGFTGANVITSLAACATYTVLQAQTPEVPSTLLLPVSAAAVGFGTLLVARRRRSRSNPA